MRSLPLRIDDLKPVHNCLGCINIESGEMPLSTVLAPPPIMTILCPPLIETLAAVVAEDIHQSDLVSDFVSAELGPGPRLFAARASGPGLEI